MRKTKDMNDNLDKIAALKSKLKAARQSGVGRNADDELRKKELSQDDNSNSMNIGLRAGSELIVGMIAGGLVGYGLDYVIGTKAIFFVIFLILGVGVGFLNIYKLTQNIGTSVGFAELHRREGKIEKQSTEDDHK